MPRVLFARQYRAALLDYLLGNGESGLDQAYALGRRAVGGERGLLDVVRTHQDAVMSILESSRGIDDVMRALEASHAFLLEVLAAFDMASRGYFDLVSRSPR